MLAAGKLNRRVTIQRPGATQDAAGQPVEAWIDVATVWAGVLMLSGLETIKADGPVSQVKASVRIRWRTDIDAGMRVVLGSSVFAIKAVIRDEVRREFIDLVCEVAQ